LKKLKFHGIMKNSWERYNSRGEFAYEVIEPGFKYNMMDIQAAIGLKQLEKLEGFIHKREQLAFRYDKFFKRIESIGTQKLANYRFRHAHHLYVIMIDIDKLSSRENFMQLLKDFNIGSGLHFTPIHLHKYYSEKYGYRRGCLPNTEFIGERIVSIPLFPKMTAEDQENVIDAINKILSDIK